MDEQFTAEPQSFEQALARLEEIAALLDRNEVPLAEALELCAEAAQLTRFCRTQLSEAEGKLEQLVEAANGTTRLEPLDEENF
ncbi:MAG: exodeoxyribonuclease VII small subunit [Armatimonadota bacterium]